MRQIALVFLLASLMGCQQPSDVRLEPDNYTTDLEVIPVTAPSPQFQTNPVDSSGILPSDQVNYHGQFSVTRVVLDAGNGKVNAFAYARVFVADSAVEFGSGVIGYNGADLGQVRLNGTLMVKVPHRIAAQNTQPRDTLLTRGSEYVGDLTGSYEPNAIYTWSTGMTTFGSLNLSIQSPDLLEVGSPIGGSVVHRDRDLSLRWHGANGQLTIIVSEYNPLTGETHPVLELRPRTTAESALLPSWVLRQFPLKRYFVFTFILSNRREVSILSLQQNKVLIQAASIYNCYVEFQ